MKLSIIIVAWRVQDKLKNNIPHYIVSPKCCKRCEKWGNRLNDQDICENCFEALL